MIDTDFIKLRNDIDKSYESIGKSECLFALFTFDPAEKNLTLIHNTSDQEWIINELEHFLKLYKKDNYRMIGELN